MTKKSVFFNWPKFAGKSDPKPKFADKSDPNLEGNNWKLVPADVIAGTDVSWRISVQLESSKEPYNLNSSISDGWQNNSNSLRANASSPWVAVTTSAKYW